MKRSLPAPSPRTDWEKLSIPVLEKDSVILECIYMEESQRERSEFARSECHDICSDKVYSMRGQIATYERRPLSTPERYDLKREGFKLRLLAYLSQADELVTSWMNDENKPPVEEILKLTKQFEHWNRFFVHTYQSNHKFVEVERYVSESVAIHYFPVLLRFFYLLTCKWGKGFGKYGPCMRPRTVPSKEGLPLHLRFDDERPICSYGPKDLVNCFALVQQVDPHLEMKLSSYLTTCWCRCAEILFASPQVDWLFLSIVMHQWHYFQLFLYQSPTLRRTPQRMTGIGVDHERIKSLLKPVRKRVLAQKNAFLDFQTRALSNLHIYIQMPGLYYYNEFVDDTVLDVWTKEIQNDASRIRLLSRHMQSTYFMFKEYMQNFMASDDISVSFLRYVQSYVEADFSTPASFLSFLEEHGIFYFDRESLAQLKKLPHLCEFYMPFARQVQNYYLLEFLREWFIKITYSEEFYEPYVLFWHKVYMSPLMYWKEAMEKSYRHPLLLQWNTHYEVLYRGERINCGGNMKRTITVWFEKLMGENKGILIVEGNSFQVPRESNETSRISNRTWQFDSNIVPIATKNHGSVRGTTLKLDGYPKVSQKKNKKDIRIFESLGSI